MANLVVLNLFNGYPGSCCLLGELSSLLCSVERERLRGKEGEAGHEERDSVGAVAAVGRHGGGDVL